MNLLVKLIVALSPFFAAAQYSARSITISNRKNLSYTLTPDSLSRQLTAGYTTDREKVASIFQWITENISYNIRPYYNASHPSRNERFYDDEEDTGALKPLSERVAIDVIRKRSAFCDGYARLFKTLCDYANIRSEIISGYADVNRGGREKFHSNHRWNAVYLDSSWQLLDATWASGYITYNTNNFIQHYTNKYFLTPAIDFARDHYPEDLQWTLLPQPPERGEFRYSPFKTHAFFRNYIRAYAPATGILEAYLGDTLLFEMETAIPKKNMRVLDTAFVDSAIIAKAISDTLQLTGMVVDNKVAYKYIVTSPADKWLTVVMNDEVIMRYKLNIRKGAIVAK